MAQGQFNKPIHTVFQVSTSDALVTSVYDGEVSVQAILDHGGEAMKTSTLSLALGVMLASPVAAYPSETPYGQVHRHRTIHHAPHHPTVVSQWRDPFKPRTTNGLSSNPNACASYGCVGAGGGGD
jgi:hypothetical protein